MDVDEPENDTQAQASEPQNDGGSQGEADLAAKRAEAEAGIAALQQKKQSTKVSQKKVDQVKVRFYHSRFLMNIEKGCTQSKYWPCFNEFVLSQSQASSHTEGENPGAPQSRVKSTDSAS